MMPRQRDDDQDKKAPDKEAPTKSDRDKKTVAAVAALIAELRPDIPPPIAGSLAAEALDQADEPSIDELDPDRRWAQMRVNTYPAAVLEARRAAAYMARTGPFVHPPPPDVEDYDVDRRGHYRATRDGHCDGDALGA
ncbi:hypothetical protein [Actinopolymorpha alba]|uniref:hypothetical protein n=1 Tax=Actinopolymorpha alba TaxID=533267 RepID=UPI0003A54798|nr:hypothetical protein [Actinopolymorpha alba]